MKQIIACCAGLRVKYCIMIWPFTVATKVFHRKSTIITVNTQATVIHRISQINNRFLLRSVIPEVGQKRLS